MEVIYAALVFVVGVTVVAWAIRQLADTDGRLGCILAILAFGGILIIGILIIGAAQGV